MENGHHHADERPSKYANLEEVNETMNPTEQTSDSSVSIVKESSQELEGKLPNEIFVYREDVVTCRKYEALLGVVMEVAGDSDSEGSLTDDSDSNDDGESSGNGGGGDVDGNGNTDGGDKYDPLPDGQVRVIWTDGSETTENISDITVVDRGFLHGDIVASASDPTGQLGLIVDVNITADLLAANGEVIKHVSSKDLKHTREPLVGDYVVFGPWLGRVDDVLDNVTVLFDDGSVCKVAKADPLRLKPLMRPVTDDASCPYYPGQRVKAVSSSVFKSSRWLSGLWKANRLEGTVIKVQAASVVVYWIASAHLGIGTNSANVPAEEQDPKNLTLLSCFSYANWQLGDWCHLLSPPLPSSSFADEASKTSKEPIQGSMSDVKHSEDSILDECTDINISSVTDGSGQALVSEAPNPEAGVQDETVKSNGVITSDDFDLNYVSGRQGDGCSENSSPFLNSGNLQPQSCDSMTIDKITEVGESNGTVSNNVLPESGSCSNSSSVPKELTHESWPAYRKKLRKVFFKRDKKARRREETFERALFIVNTVTRVDVAWQDGTREYGLDSKSLIPVHTPSDHEFFPENYVVEKALGDDSSETKRVGIVRSVNSKELTVCVRWFKPVSRPEDSREFDCDEVVSAYELDGHPDYDYCYGDVVVRLSPVSVSADTADYGSPVEQLEQRADKAGAEGNESSKQSDYDESEQLAKEEACADFSSLSWVGNITGLQNGDIEVTWADGMVSKVGPQAVFVVGREDDAESFDSGSEVSDDGASWETIDENETDRLEDAEKETDLQSPTENILEREKQAAIPPEDDNAGTNGPLSMPLAALGFVTRLATGLFSRGRKHIDLSDTDNRVVIETESKEAVEVSDKEVARDELSYEESDAFDNLTAKNVPVNAERHGHAAATEGADEAMRYNLDSSMSVETNADRKGADSRDDPCSFKHFDISENPIDHNFIGSSGQNTGGRKWVKKVHQEWSILEKNLPDAIYVRVFEDRMDLLRAVIVGACGTPYQDGLFFFDFHLPSEYPQVPPLAYYHSGGLRVNPNLYVDGKVCLSLLNTWTGKENEVWDPSSSSILQVLVSLQGLVLNSRPYFNEAGYDKQVGTVEGEKNSMPYNENTYLLNLKSMLYLLRRPPMHFEGFVRDHFRRRGHYILKACEAYMDGGCTIGSLTRDACATERSRDHPCSTGFKLMLAKILPKLFSALTEVGADCRQFVHLQNSERPPPQKLNCP